MPTVTWSSSTPGVDPPVLRSRVIGPVTAVPRDEWNALDLGGRPFLRHEFLHAAEDSGSATPETGWTPAHVVAEAGDALVGAMPLYVKTHSWGEFVFDFAWARAYEQHGLVYYPKLVAAVPFTPAAGPRLLVQPGQDASAVRASLLAAARDLATELDASSLHVLFAGEDENDWLASQGLIPRMDCQFHWENRGFESFEGFLATFTAEKRKKVRRERRRVAEAGIRFRELRGGELDEALLDTVYQLHARTFAERGNPPYFTPAFFQDLARDLPDALMVKLAVLGEVPVACAVFLRGADALYGRYWGAMADFHSLHFETCYYQGIDYCIREGLARFEPGTQGEHKVARGFAPSAVWSAHDIRHPGFRAAVAEYLGRERDHVRAYMDAVRAHVPFRRAEPAITLKPPSR